MFKDSIIFQLELVLKLDNYGLTLKDFLPNNVIFNHGQPIFVDFLSLIPTKQLAHQKWLYVGVANKAIPAHQLLFSKMFIPHLLIPLLLYGKHNYPAGREMLEFKACNLGNGRPVWNDVFQSKGNWSLNSLLLTVKAIKLAIFPKTNYLDTIRGYHQIVRSLDVTNSHSDYLNYYLSKGEDYSFTNQKQWKIKQKQIHQIIHTLKPKTTLDIGANTGWYSFLAEFEGSSVIATDIDEGTIDALYLKIRNTHKRILPLMLSFSAFTERSNSKAYLPAITRFRSDLVMCLALIHHLVLGQGLSVEKVIRTLAKLSDKVVILEYVDINDEKIQQDPSFFPLINGTASRMYSLVSIVKVAKKYFRKIDIINSTEVTRKLLVFSHQSTYEYKTPDYLHHTYFRISHCSWSKFTHC